MARNAEAETASEILVPPKLMQVLSGCFCNVLVSQLRQHNRSAIRECLVVVLDHAMAISSCLDMPY